MATASGIHTAICAALEAVAGLTESTLPWSVEAFPETLHSGGFIVRPVSDGVGATLAGKQSSDALRFEVLLPWRLTGSPSAHARAGMTKVEAIRAALANSVLDEARVVVGEATYTYSDDGHRMAATIPLIAYAFLDL